MIDEVSAFAEADSPWQGTKLFPRQMTAIKIPWFKTLSWEAYMKNDFTQVKTIYAVLVIPKANVKKVRIHHVRKYIDTLYCGVKPNVQ